MKKLFKWLFSILFCICVVLPASIWIWASFDGSLAQGLKVVSWFDDKIIQTTGVKGSLKSGGEIEHLKLNFDKLNIKADDVKVNWNFFQLLFLNVSVNSIQAEQITLDFDLKDDSNDDETATKKIHHVPNNLIIPVFLNIKNIDVKRGDLLNLPGGDIGIDNLKGNLKYNGLSYTVDAQQVQAENLLYKIQGKANGNLSVLRPFKIKANVEVQAQKRVIPSTKKIIAKPASYKLNLIASNNLETLNVDGSLLQTVIIQNSRQTRSINANAIIEPWHINTPINRIAANFNRLNLYDFFEDLPNTSLSGNALLVGGKASKLTSQINNLQVGSFNENLLPIKQLKVNATLSDDWHNFNVRKLELQLNQGNVVAQGKLRLAQDDNEWIKKLLNSDIKLNSKLNNVNPSLLNKNWHISNFDGSINIDNRAGNKSGAVIGIDLHPNSSQVQHYPITSKLQAKITEDAIVFDKVNFELNAAKLNASGKLRLSNYKFNGNISANIPGINLDFKGDIEKTKGNAKLALKLTDIEKLQHWLKLLPIAPDFINSYKLAGQLDIKAIATNGWQLPNIKANLIAKDFNMSLPKANSYIDKITLKNLAIDLNGRLNNMKAAIDIKIAGDTSIWQWQSRGVLGYHKAKNQWQALVTKLDLSGQLLKEKDITSYLSLVEPVAGSWTTSNFTSAAGAMTISSTTPIHQTQPIISKLHWGETSIDFSSDGIKKLTSKGKFNQAAWYWLRFFAPEFSKKMNAQGNLLLDLDWQIQMQNKLNAQLHLRRNSGDILWNSADLEQSQKNARGQIKHSIILNKKQNNHQDDVVEIVPIKLNEFDIKLDIKDNQLHADANINSEMIGGFQTDFRTELTLKNNIWVWQNNAPISGAVSAEVANLSLLNRLILPVGWKLAGKLNLQAKLGGCRNKPAFKGSINGRKLIMSSAQHRLGISNGEIDLTLDDSVIKVQNISFNGFGGGSLNSTGDVRWVDGVPVLKLDTKLTKLQLSKYDDRRLSVSGELNSLLRMDNIAITGALMADHANIVLPDVFSPSLGEDVELVIPNEENIILAKPKFRPKMDINIKFGFGNNFVLNGYGIKTNLVGNLELKYNDSNMQIFGTVNTKNGEFRAYGQWLKITEGRVNFTGNYTNPTFYVLALRPHLREVQVGVQITGTALSPNIQLFSQPEMAKEEKLAWLLLGKGGTSGAEAAILQQAMISLAGGKQYGGGLIKNFGIDQLNFDTPDDNKDGSISLSKQITDNLYVTYQHSFGDVSDLLSLFYDLSTKWTIRLQLSTRNALDLIYTTRFD